MNNFKKFHITANLFRYVSMSSKHLTPLCSWQLLQFIWLPVFSCFTNICMVNVSVQVSTLWETLIGFSQDCITIFCSIHLYLSFTSFPVSFDIKLFHSVLQPPPWFTVETMFIAWGEGGGLHQTWWCPWWTKSYILVYLIMTCFFGKVFFSFLLATPLWSPTLVFRTDTPISEELQLHQVISGLL